MNTLLQDVLKYNPKLDDSGDGLKISHALEILVKELERRRAASDGETFDAEQDRVMALVKEIGGRKLSSQVDYLVGSCMNLYADAAFALGYHTAKHPEWLIFDNQIDDDIRERLNAPCPGEDD